MAISWWVVDALEKVFPESRRPVDAAGRVFLRACRRETEDAQVAIEIPPKQRVTKATFAFTDLKGPRGAKISKDCCEGFWEWYVYVQANPPGNADPATYLRKAPAFFPDAFLEEKEVGLRGGVTQPLWLSVRVPADAAPGEYKGHVTVSLTFRYTGALERFSVPIVVQVWPLTLPEKPTLRHTEWFEPGTLADYYHCEPWSETHWTWLGRVARDMAAHKQDMILTRYPGLVKTTETKTGRLQFDFTRLDRWLDTFEGAGVDWIEGGHIARRTGDWESPIDFLRWPVEGPNGKPIDTSPDAMSSREFEKYVKGILKATYDHIKARGLADRLVQHIADEPVDANVASWTRISAKVRKWLPGVPRIDATMAEGLEDYCEIRVPQIQHVMEPSKRKPPKELWSYVCLAPQGIYPNRFLDYASIRNRILFWLSWSLNLKGFLHWGYAHWRVWQCLPVDIPVSPWMDCTGASIYSTDCQPLPAGDTHIVYPGRRSICSSIRWEVIRKGFEDYELLRMFEQAVRRPAKRSAPAASRGKALLEGVKRSIAPDPARHTHDAGALVGIRRAIGETLTELVPEK